MLLELKHKEVVLDLEAKDMREAKEKELVLLETAWEEVAWALVAQQVGLKRVQGF